jgi:hypothetical protein
MAAIFVESGSRHAMKTSAQAWLEIATARDRSSQEVPRRDGSPPDKVRTRTKVVVQRANPKATELSSIMQTPLRERAEDTCTPSLSVVYERSIAMNAASTAV